MYELTLLTIFTIWLGDQHRKQRKLLNPAFSMANMREIHPIVQPIAEQVASILLDQVTEASEFCFVSSHGTMLIELRPLRGH